MVMPGERELERLLEFAIGIAREAGAATMERFGAHDLLVESKPDGSPVSESDRRAEALLRERIRAVHPGDGILGEEEEEEPGSSGRTWILDPIDGTRSYAQGVPLFGTLVGLEIEGEPALGVIHMPALGELAAAAAGIGARWQRRGDAPRPARVSTTARLADALACSTSTKAFDEAGQRAPYARLLGAVRSDRGWGDCYAHLLLATGRVDLVLEPRMSVWDCAALLPVVEEAGGSFTDLAGRRTIRGGNALATNGRLLAETLRVLWDGDERGAE
jgi:histidinol phosphatase-like enzyme (inositol monophosphatase family)